MPTLRTRIKTPTDKSTNVSVNTSVVVNTDLVWGGTNDGYTVFTNTFLIGTRIPLNVILQIADNPSFQNLKQFSLPTRWWDGQGVSGWNNQAVQDVLRAAGTNIPTVDMTFTLPVGTLQHNTLYYQRIAIDAVDAELGLVGGANPIIVNRTYTKDAHNTQIDDTIYQFTTEPEPQPTGSSGVSGISGLSGYSGNQFFTVTDDTNKDAANLASNQVELHFYAPTDGIAPGSVLVTDADGREILFNVRADQVFATVEQGGDVTADKTSITLEPGQSVPIVLNGGQTVRKVAEVPDISGQAALTITRPVPAPTPPAPETMYVKANAGTVGRTGQIHVTSFFSNNVLVIHYNIVSVTP